MAKKKNKRSTKSKEDRQFEKAEKVMRRRWRQLLSRKGVTHVDVNYRTRKGKRTREVAIVVHVEKKLAEEQLRHNRCFRSIDGVPVDIVVSRNTYGQQTGKPLQGGDKTAPQHKPSEGGTLGIVCFALGSRLPRFLTNAHVVFGGKKKSELPSKIPMVRPSGQHPLIGHGIRSKSFRDALVDCALIEPADGQSFLPGVKKIQPPPTGFGRLTRQDVNKKVRVKKVGASTGEREGIVDSVRLTFSTPGHGFLFQIGIKPVDGGPPFSRGGDSGSVVLRGQEIVGLLHGVTNSGQIAVACHIDQVVGKLKIEL